VKWGERVVPKVTSDVDLPPCSKSAVEMVREFQQKKATGRAA
jgi:hypothetical protein